VSAAPGLYVHVPFCKSKCRYCGFYSVTSDELLDRWLRLLPTEAKRAGQAFSEFDTLYVGGGTPSLLRPARLAEVLGTLGASLPLSADAEVTVELNPDDVTDALIEALAAAGVTRCSVGVQSFDDGALRLLGRRHDVRQTGEALARLRPVGRLAVDVIFGWPGQTPAARRADLDAALEWAPDHLSCYELTVEPGTPLAADVEAGRLRLPDEGAQADLFLAASAHLRAAGFEHYEVSNYARGPTQRSRHNSKYWAHVPYLGLGPAAHSFRGRRRWWNASDLEVHLDRLAAGADPAEGSEALDDEQLRLEALMLGLRTSDGVALDVVESFAGWRSVVDASAADGLLRVRDGRLRPTREGLLRADGLARALAGRA